MEDPTWRAGECGEGQRQRGKCEQRHGDAGRSGVSRLSVCGSAETGEVVRGRGHQEPDDERIQNLCYGE